MMEIFFINSLWEKLESPEISEGKKKHVGMKNNHIRIFSSLTYQILCEG